MKKSLTAFVAAAMLAVVPLAASTAPADAGNKLWKNFGKGVATGVGVGVGLGIVNNLSRPRQQVIVQQPQPVYVQPAPQPVYVQPAPQPVYVQPVQGFSQAHYNECFRRAPNSYNPNTNTYVRLNGQVVVCHTPY